MNFGINPHWGIFINDWRVGDWSNFAVNRGFKALEFTVDFRMLEKGLSRVFDRKILGTLTRAGERGLKFHVSTEPFKASLGSHRISDRDEGIKRLHQILKFFESNLRPQYVILHPGSCRRDDRRAIDWMIDGYRRLRDKFPSLRLGLKVGGKGNCLQEPVEVHRVISRLHEIPFCLDIGTTVMNSGGDLRSAKNIIRAIGRNLHQISWHNFLFRPLRRRLPLGRGYLGESHYVRILSLLQSPMKIWHVLDYRDRSRKWYENDKLTLEDLAFRNVRSGR